MIIQRMSRLIMVLRVSIYVVIAFQIVGSISTFANDEDIFLKIDGEIWQQSVSDFSVLDQMFLGLIIMASAAVFFWALYQLLMLCRLFDKGVIFSGETIRYFKAFAKGLIAMALVDSLITPVLIVFLWVRDAIPAFPDVGPLWLLESLQVDVLAFGILFFVIARIMETGLEIMKDRQDLKEELDLTI